MNVILIIIDALRCGKLGAYDSQPSSSPNIDQWAKKAVVFENAYTTITKTDPSRTAILSGFYPASLGFVNHGTRITPKEEKSLENFEFLPEILKSNRYRTFAVDWLARWHKRGFDYYSGRLSKKERRSNFAFVVRDPFLLRWSRALDVLSLKFFRRDFFMRFYYCFVKNTQIPYDTADRVIKKAIKLISENKKKKFYLQLHLWDVHYPLVRPSGVRSYLFDSLQDRYNAEISFVDQQLGRLFEYLEKEKKLEDTLVILTADHGESLTEHGIYWAHRGLYEEVVKVPLILRHPSLLPQRIVDSLVQTVDITPTILDFLGIKLKEDLDGVSLLPLIRGKKKRVRDCVYFEDLSYGEWRIKKSSRRRAIRWDVYKYISTYKGAEEDLFKLHPSKKLVVKEEIYNLARDPREEKNLVFSNKRLTVALRKKFNHFIYQLQKASKKNLSLRREKLSDLSPDAGKEKKQVMKRLEELGYF